MCFRLVSNCSTSKHNYISSDRTIVAKIIGIGSNNKTDGIRTSRVRRETWEAVRERWRRIGEISRGMISVLGRRFSVVADAQMLSSFKVDGNTFEIVKVDR